MSIIRPVLRVCAVAALRSSTFAMERVADSDNGPLLDALLDTAPKPYITVFTDDDIRTEFDGMDFSGSTRRISLAIESGVGTAVIIKPGDPAQLRVPQTNEAMELLLDVLESQITDALFCTPSSPWCQLIKQMVLRIDRVPMTRGGAADKGTRWAARNVTYVCECISDPSPGVPLPDGHPINAFLTLAETNPITGLDTLSSAKIIRTIYDPSLPPALRWKQIEALMGISSTAVTAIGLGPALPALSEESEPALETILPDDPPPAIVPYPTETEEPHYNYQKPPAEGEE